MLVQKTGKILHEVCAKLDNKSNPVYNAICEFLDEKKIPIEQIFEFNEDNGSHFLTLNPSSVRRSMKNDLKF